MKTITIQCNAGETALQATRRYLAEREPNAAYPHLIVVCGGVRTWWSPNVTARDAWYSIIR